MAPCIAEIGITENLILAAVVAAFLVLTAREWRSARRRSEKWRVGALAVIGTMALGWIVVGLAGG
jgi:hypothetical protein